MKAVFFGGGETMQVQLETISPVTEIKVLKDPVQRILSQLTPNTPRRLIGLIGLPGAGKSTLAEHLGETVNQLAGPDTLTVLGMDGFHLSKFQLRALPQPEEAFKRRGAPWTFDAAAMAARLSQIRQCAGMASVLWPDFQHEVGDPIEDVHEVCPQTRIVLVEGLYLLHDADGWEEVGPHFDEVWYLDTPLETAMERLARRNMAAWKLTREAVENRIASNDRLNAEIVLKTRTRADWQLKELEFETH